MFALSMLAGCKTNVLTVEEVDRGEIVTSFYPVYYLADEIAGDYFEVINLTQGKDPHSYSLTPQDMQIIQDSELFVFQGAGLEAWAEDFYDKEGLNTLELADELDLLEADHDDEDNHEDEHHDEGHKEDEHHDDHDEEHEEDEHNHGAYDPHTWLDPILAKQMAEQVRDAIVELDPENEDIYDQRYQAVLKSFDKLDVLYSSTLDSCSNKVAISSHDAFSYLENRYNFELISISGLSPQSIPSSQKLQELINLTNQEGITHILEEEFADQSFSDVIQSETSLSSLIINTLESTPPQGEDYVTVMEDNLKSFTQAFNCN